jgi:hypothetical protein
MWRMSINSPISWQDLDYSPRMNKSVNAKRKRKDQGKAEVKRVNKGKIRGKGK